MEGVGIWISWAAGFLILGWLLKALQRLWWTPRTMEKKIRELGIDGTSYRFLFGDLRESMRLYKEAKLKPMPYSHDIVPRAQPFVAQLAKTYGKVYLTWLGPSPRIIIADPALIREVLLNKTESIGKPKPSRVLTYLLSGLVTLDREKWAVHRKIINPAFHIEKLKRMQPAFSSCCAELVGRWESLLGDKESCELDVWPELQNFTRDVISRAAFGSSFEQGQRIFQLLDELAKLTVESFANFQIPGYRFLPTKTNLRMKEIDAEVNSLLRGIIAKRETALQKGSDVNDDLLGLLLQSNESQMTREEIIDECKLFYFAGQETTSNLLTWAMVTLAMNPNWQSRARAEVLQVYNQEKPDFERLSQLKIVSMIIQEVLRLYPPAIFLLRSVKAPTMIGEYTFPEGVQLLLHVLLVQHDPDYWGKDANEFIPERFSEGISKAAERGGLAFFSFGGGPRICVGQGFAMAEAKMGLASILQKFSFELSPAYTHAPFTVLTLQPQHGAQLILHRL
ncbi:cytochrome P450 CYP72A616-like [Wolffia australiana]